MVRGVREPRFDCILKVLVSNPGRHTINSYWGLRGLHQDLQAFSGMVRSLEYDRYFLNPFQFINRILLPFNAL
jgi:hypothetical protein